MFLCHAHSVPHVKNIFIQIHYGSLLYKCSSNQWLYESTINDSIVFVYTVQFCLNGLMETAGESELWAVGDMPPNKIEFCVKLCWNTVVRMSLRTTMEEEARHTITM